MTPLSPTFIDGRVLADKIAVIDRMLADLRALPVDDLDAFVEDSRTPAAAESYLRRALEALMDLGRHLLAKGFGLPVDEYAAIADRLREVGMLDPQETSRLREMAKYRNRMVHFYAEITQPELYDIITQNLDDFGLILGAINRWLAQHPGRVREDA